jgi:quinol monooxygenase YgiN
MAVTVLAIIKAKVGMEAQVEEALKALIEPTRQESGCINYDLHVLSDDPTVFMFHENWNSKEDLDEHLSKPYIEQFLSQAETFLAEPVIISLYDRIG